MHERGIRVCFGITVSSFAKDLKCFLIIQSPVIPFLQLFILPLQRMLTAPGAMNESDLFAFDLPVKFPERTLQHCGIDLLSLLQHSCCFFFESCIVLFDGSAPHKRIFIGIGFDLRTIQEDLFKADLFLFHQELDHLKKQVFQTCAQMFSDESADRIMVRYFLPLQQIPVAHIIAARFFDLPR